MLASYTRLDTIIPVSRLRMRQDTPRLPLFQDYDSKNLYVSTLFDASPGMVGEGTQA